MENISAHAMLSILAQHRAQVCQQLDATMFRHESWLRAIAEKLGVEFDDLSVPPARIPDSMLKPQQHLGAITSCSKGLCKDTPTEPIAPPWSTPQSAREAACGDVRTQEAQETAISSNDMQEAFEPTCSNKLFQEQVESVYNSHKLPQLDHGDPFSPTSSVGSRKRLSLTRAMIHDIHEKGKTMQEFFEVTTSTRRRSASGPTSENLKGPVPDEDQGPDAPKSLKYRYNQLVNSSQFELFFAAMILSSAVMSGIEVQYKSVTKEPSTPPTLYLVMHAYNILFLVEWTMRVVADGVSFFCTRDACWNLLDTVIVALSVMETIIDIQLTDAAYGTTHIENVSSARVVRIVRIARLARLFRIGRLLRFIAALRTMVYSILATLFSLVWAMILLLIIIFVFAIVFTQASTEHLMEIDVSKYGELEASLDTYWSTLLGSMYSLFLAISGGVSWIEIAKPLLDLKGGAAYGSFMLVYICFVYFAVLNVVTGVFCQTAIESAQNDHAYLMQEAQKNKDSYVAKLTELFHRIDVDGSGCVSFEELDMVCKDPKYQAYFAALDVHTHDAYELFRVLDADAGGQVDLDEFILGCLQMKGVAKGLEVMKVVHMSKRIMKALVLMMTHVDHKLSSIEAKVQSAQCTPEITI